MEETGTGDGVEDWGWEGGFKQTHKRLASSAMESKQSEIVWAQELACASELPPTEQSEGAPLGDRSPCRDTENPGGGASVSENHLI